MASEQHAYAYSMQDAYTLGDKYLVKISQDTGNQNQCFLAAKLCYLLPTIDHPRNDKEYIKPQKLMDLEQLKSKYKITCDQIKEKFPNEVLGLLKAFYAVWLPEIRQYLKERILTRINKRQDAFMVIFQKFSSQRLDVSHIKNAILKRHNDDVDAWDGPEFQHLKMENNQRGKNVDYLTAVKDKDGYKKRCANSQDNWSKKGQYDAEFFVVCIQKAREAFGSDMALRVQFGKEILEEKVKFKSSPKTYLILNSWMFSRVNCPSLTAIAALLDIDKSKCNGGGGGQQKRDNLMRLCQKQCSIHCRENANDMKEDNISTMPFSSDSTIETTSNRSNDRNQQQLNVHHNNNNVMPNTSSFRSTSTQYGSTIASTSTQYGSTSSELMSVDRNQSPQTTFTGNNNNNNNQPQQPSFNGTNQSGYMGNNQILQIPQHIDHQQYQMVVASHSQHVGIQHNIIHPVYQQQSQHPHINNMMNRNNNNYNQYRLHHDPQTQQQLVSHPQHNNNNNHIINQQHASIPFSSSHQQQQMVYNRHDVHCQQYQQPSTQQQYTNNNMMHGNNNYNQPNQQNNNNYNDSDMVAASRSCADCGAKNGCAHRGYN